MKRSALLCLAMMLTTRQLSAEELYITPRQQETYVWCWVAVGQMVFEHYEVPNVNPGGDYQCGIIGLLAAGTMRHDCAFRCQNCTVPAGSAAGVKNMIEEYPKRVAAVGDEDVPRLQVSYFSRALSFEGIRDEIDDGHPIIAGISPSGRPSRWTSSQHVALIVGYEEGDDDERVLVNDPYPFAANNPYVAAGGENNGDGSYWISFRTFRDRLDWAESFVVKDVGTWRATPKGNYCCFVGPYGADACPLNLSGSLPLGSPCTCTYPAARFAGRVCNP